MVSEVEETENDDEELIEADDDGGDPGIGDIIRVKLRRWLLNWMRQLSKALMLPLFRRLRRPWRMQQRP
jgi:hypothetical protein